MRPHREYEDVQGLDSGAGTQPTFSGRKMPGSSEGWREQKGTGKMESIRGEERGRMASRKNSEKCVFKKFSPWKLAWTPHKINCKKQEKDYTWLKDTKTKHN